MGKDYYGVLGVDKGADEATLKKAYRTKAMKWHPDKNKDNRTEAEARFKEISEAFEVLSDPQKKRIYDAYGEDGLKGGGPGDAGSGSGFSGGSFRPRAAEDIFAEFFGSSGASSFFSSSGPGTQTFFSTAGGPDIAGMHGMGGMPGRASVANNAPQTVQRALPCSLEDLYTGRNRKMKIKRTIIDGNSGRPMDVEEIVEIDVKAGWKDGTKVTFAGKGDELRGRPAQDIQFVIKEQAHAVFKREGNDLTYTARISLKDALVGGRFQLHHLNGSNVPVSFVGPVSPATVQAMRGLGMPISKEAGKFGDLRVKFDVSFPSQLSDDQKQRLKEIL